MAVEFDTQALMARIRGTVMAEVIKSTEAVRDEAISLILNTEKTGRVYPRKGVRHVASAPGEAPASDTGTLVNNINTQYDFTNYTGTITVSVNYGLMLEFGTVKMEPRPYLRPALANKAGEIESNIAIALRREFRL